MRCFVNLPTGFSSSVLQLFTGGSAHRSTVDFCFFPSWSPYFVLVHSNVWRSALCSLLSVPSSWSPVGQSVAYWGGSRNRPPDPLTAPPCLPAEVPHGPNPREAGAHGNLGWAAGREWEAAPCQEGDELRPVWTLFWAEFCRANT